MKKNHLLLLACLFAGFTWSCNNSGKNTSSGDTSTSSNSSTTTSNTIDTMNNANATTPTTSTNATKMMLSKDDSMFVMEAAAGGMEEVELGNVAQQMAANQRVKDFGSMMVRDHSKANDELKSLASSKGINLPDSLPASKKKEVDMMKKMTGKGFDNHYVSMMVEDHKKDVAKFKKMSETAKDADLKNWAAKTLPTLQTHLDSIQAISKAKM